MIQSDQRLNHSVYVAKYNSHDSLVTEIDSAIIIMTVEYLKFSQFAKWVDPRGAYPREGPGGLSRECAPPYPQRDRKRRLNGAVCRNHRIKRLVPCRC